MTLHMIHAPLDLRDFGRWAGTRGMAGRVPFDEGAALHRLLAALFGKGATQPFRLFAPSRARHATLYAYSPLDAAALAETARGCAAPDDLAVLRLDRLISKAMPTAFAPGRRLGFDIRARPVRRILRPLHDPRSPRHPMIAAGSEIDCFRVEALTRFPRADTDGGEEAEQTMAAAGRSREVVYRDWLAERLAPAARILDCRLARFQRTRAVRSSRAVEGPDATLHGTLEVVDSDRFHDLLARGVGRHRAYGYGMLVLRPPGRAPLSR